MKNVATAHKESCPIAARSVSRSHVLYLIRDRHAEGCHLCPQKIRKAME